MCGDGILEVRKIAVGPSAPPIIAILVHLGLKYNRRIKARKIYLSNGMEKIESPKHSKKCFLKFQFLKKPFIQILLSF